MSKTRVITTGTYYLHNILFTKLNIWKISLRCLASGWFFKTLGFWKILSNTKHLQDSFTEPNNWKIPLQCFSCILLGVPIFYILVILKKNIFHPHPTFTSSSICEFLGFFHLTIYVIHSWILLQYPSSENYFTMLLIHTSWSSSLLHTCCAFNILLLHFSFEFNIFIFLDLRVLRFLS